MDIASELTHISLCTGYAGIDLGLKRALQKIRTVCYVEIEAFVIFNLVKKIEAKLLDAAPIFTDLKRFPWEQFTGRVDILSGGFPCQPFSAAGQRAGDEDPRHLWPYIVQGIRELGRPPIVFFENVEGIISSKLKGDRWADPEGTPVLLHVLRELERLGYKATAGVFSAREVGAPHQRKRVFIMGVRSDLGQSGRDLVSRMLRDTESGVKLVDSCDNGRKGRRASLQEKRGSLDRGGQGVQKKRDASDADTEDASGSDGYVEHTEVKRSEGPDGGISEQQGLCVSFRESSTAYPAPRGAEQHIWEPPRVTELGNTDSRNKRPQGKTKSEMGGDLNGASRWMDYAELCESLDNRTDELRMLGNGVIPDTAEKAFRLLWERINF